MDVDVLEGDFVHEFEPHHDHPGHPEEDDVKPRHHERRGIEVIERWGPFGPAHRGEGPERAAEPGVQDVLILSDVPAAALLALCGVRLGDGDVPAVGAGPGRDAVPPPQLTGDAPVPDVLHPVKVRLLPLRGRPRDAPLFDGLNAALRKRLRPDEPLFGKAGLHGGPAPLAVADGVLDLLGPLQQPQRVEVLRRGLARLLQGHAPIPAGVLVHDALGIDDLNLLQVVPLSHQEVVGVVGRRDLDAARPELRVHHVVLDDGDLAIRQGDADPFSDHAAVLLRSRVHRDGHVSQDRLRARRRHEERSLLADEGVAHVIELSGHLPVLHLQVGEGGVAAGAPVDDVLALVDQVLLVQAHKHRPNGAGQPLVERKALAPPVAGVSQPLHLLDDAVAVDLLPLPDLLHEGLTPEVVAGQAFLCQVLLHDVLRRDARVVRPGEPEDAVSLHAFRPAQDVLKGVVEGVPHVERPRDVRGRDHNGKGLFGGVGLRIEQPLLQPERIPLLLDGIGRIALGELSVPLHYNRHSVPKKIPASRCRVKRRFRTATLIAKEVRTRNPKLNILADKAGEDKSPIDALRRARRSFVFFDVRLRFCVHFLSFYAILVHTASRNGFQRGSLSNGTFGQSV